MFDLVNTSGKRIKLLRVAAQIEQAELARRVGMTQGFISMLENDQRRLQLDPARAIAKALNTTPAYLLCLTNTHEQEDARVPA